MADINLAMVGEEKAPAKWPEFPALTILIQPRKTIRAIVDTNPTKYTILLVILVGIAQGLDNAAGDSVRGRLTWQVAMIFGVVLGPIFAIVGWSIGAAIFNWLGGLFGGRASTGEVRAAMAWSAVPFIANLAFWPLLLVLYRSELFTMSTARIDQNPLPLIIVAVLSLILNAWWFVLFWQCFAEVQRMSSIRALVAILLPPAIITGLLLICGGLTILGQ